jgi:hypothetical protein
VQEHQEVQKIQELVVPWFKHHQEVQVKSGTSGSSRELAVQAGSSGNTGVSGSRVHQERAMD